MKRGPEDRVLPQRLRRLLWVGIMLALACGTCGGCATTEMPSIRTTGNGLAEGAKRWRDRAPPEDQAEIDALLQRKDLLIHIIAGDLTGYHTRGGASAPAATPLSRRLCLLHPKVEDVRPEWNWHVIYDRRQQEDFEKEYGIPNPIEVILQHEIFGHILPILRAPTSLERIRKDGQLWKENERNAAQIENRYRRSLGLPEVPPNLQPFADP